MRTSCCDTRQTALQLDAYWTRTCLLLHGLLSMEDIGQSISQKNEPAHQRLSMESFIDGKLRSVRIQIGANVDVFVRHSTRPLRGVYLAADLIALLFIVQFPGQQGVPVLEERCADSGKAQESRLLALKVPLHSPPQLLFTLAQVLGRFGPFGHASQNDRCIVCNG